ncbi:MAG: PEP-CTERM sorting domain-containing protein [Phycisphaeraceae bacterium]
MLSDVSRAVGAVALAAAFVVSLTLTTPAAATQGGPFTEWENGLPNDPDFFPLGVWAQVHSQAGFHAQMGMNMYWSLGGFGSVEQQLTAIRNAGLYAVAHQTSEMRNLLNQNHHLLGTVVGWMQQDEPDNAKSGGNPWRYIRPPEIQDNYDNIRLYDDTRPVFMNLGQGVAWDGWHGRGTYTNNPQDYPEYQKGADILSFDIYPAQSTNAATAGELWRVAYGVKRLREWTDDDKPVWNIIEASPINTGNNEVTPHELRAEAWMSIIHGSTGIGYFVHQFGDGGHTNSLWRNDVLRPAVTALNAEITGLARVINSPTIHDVDIVQGNVQDSIATTYGIQRFGAMLKEQDGEYYLFTVRMRDSTGLGAFQIDALAGSNWEAHVLGEDRTLPVTDTGIFFDQYGGWDTRLYHIVQVPEPTSLTLLGVGGLLLLRRRRARACE